MPQYQEYTRTKHTRQRSSRDDQKVYCRADHRDGGRNRAHLN